MMSYAFKYLAEESVDTGQYFRAFIFAGCHQVTLNQVPLKERFHDRTGANLPRWQLGLCQECFIIAMNWPTAPTKAP